MAFIAPVVIGELATLSTVAWPDAFGTFARCRVCGAAGFEEVGVLVEVGLALAPRFFERIDVTATSEAEGLLSPEEAGRLVPRRRRH
jgi:hypothetical protein